jgi:transcriptional regulator of acetoin/glycerol metabolism
VIGDKDLRPLLQKTRAARPVPGVTDESLSMEQAERIAIQRALRLCDGNRTKTASLLGISRDTLYRNLRQFGEATQ